ncbi:MAG: hypothetical protein HKM07_04470 [Chlamydiae bacterium]|nr:hypothetical protein [Chlamydiota bacterium]
MSQSVQNRPQGMTPSGYSEVFTKLFIGGAAATAGLVPALPLLNVKNALQQAPKQMGQVVKGPNLKEMARVFAHFAKNPVRLFAGIGPMTVSAFPTNAVAYFVDAAAKKYLSGEEARELSKAEKVACAAFGGGVSGLVAGPAELLFVRMGNNKLGSVATATEVFATYGAKGFFRGVFPTIFREKGFAVAYLGFGSDYPVLATFIGALVTQPADTWKTRVQGDFSLRVTLLEFVKSQPMKGFFPRLGAYGAFMATAPQVKKYLEETFK